MATRKILLNNPELIIYEKCHCYASDPDCSQDCIQVFASPQSPPIISTANNRYHMPPYFVFMLCVVGAAFIFLCYITILKRHRLGIRISRRDPPPDAAEEPPSEFVDHPIWYIRTVGLPDAVIESIEVCRFKIGEKLTEGTDCSVCLTEFEEDERLRLLPKCNHAFHVLCIDTWLKSHKNCPLCRAPVVCETNEVVEQPNEDVRVSVTDQHENIDENNRNVVDNVEYHQEDEELSEQRVVQPPRRSVSMDSRMVLSAAEVEGVKLKFEIDSSKPSSSSSSSTIRSSSSSWYRAMKMVPIGMKRSFSTSSGGGKYSLPITNSRSQDFLGD